MFEYEDFMQIPRIVELGSFLDYTLLYDQDLDQFGFVDRDGCNKICSFQQFAAEYLDAAVAARLEPMNTEQMIKYFNTLTYDDEAGMLVEKDTKQEVKKILYKLDSQMKHMQQQMDEMRELSYQVKEMLMDDEDRAMELIKLKGLTA